MSTIPFTIDGKKVEGNPGEHVLDVARRYGIEIPSLCYHEALKPFGACRVCVVEITRDGKTRITPSCTISVAEGIEVITKNEKILEQRRERLALMLTRAPQSHLIRGMAAEVGVTAPSSEEKLGDGCILCGRCIRTCKEIVGVDALQFQKRGDTREVSLKLHDGNITCIGCGSCAFICPTDYIRMKQDEETRTIWGQHFPLQACKSCGARWIPKKQIEHFCQISTTPREYFDHCPDCRS